MTESIDFFFSSRPTAQERRLKAALEDGIAHDSRIEPHDPLPTEPVTLLFTSNVDKPIDRVAVYYTTDGTTPLGERGNSDNSRVVIAEPGEMLYDPKMEMHVQSWYATLPGQPDGTRVRYRADAWSLRDSGLHWYVDNTDPVSAPPINGRVFAYNVDRWQVPAWFADAVIYHVYIDRFSVAASEPALQESNRIIDFFGGTLSGVLEKLEYIQALGANCIWLSPVFESPTYHGYNPSDYYNVGRRYGTNETLRELISQAHTRGMRVILDFVANHTSNEHPSFVAAQNDPENAMRSWYSFDEQLPHGYRSYAHVANMPELVTEHPDVQRYLFEAALHWLSYFGADGLRLDYVPGPPHAFWTLFQREIKQHFPDALTLGEITPPLQELINYAGRMDAFMDFSLAKLLRSTFALRGTTLAEFLTFLDDRLPLLPAGMGRATLLDNHDMHRFLWLAEGDIERLKLAATCQMTLDGSPIIYYGTEVGLSQYADAYKENAHARAAMLWGERQNLSLLDHFRKLVSLRLASPALRYGSRMNLKLDLAEQVKDQVGGYLRFLRRPKQTTEFLLVILNNGREPAQVRLPLQKVFQAAGIEIATIQALRNLLNTMDTYEIANTAVEFELPAMSAFILGPTERSSL